MKIAVIKQLAGGRTRLELREAEEALIAEHTTVFKDRDLTDDVCEQLTHLLAARWIQDHMHEQGVALPAAVRAYAQKVRDTIS